MYRSCRYQHQTKAGIAEKRAVGHLGYMGNVPDLACEIGEARARHGPISGSRDLTQVPPPLAPPPLAPPLSPRVTPQCSGPIFPEPNWVSSTFTKQGRVLGIGAQVSPNPVRFSGLEKN